MKREKLTFQSIVVNVVYSVLLFILTVATLVGTYTYSWIETTVDKMNENNIYVSDNVPGFESVSCGLVTYCIDAAGTVSDCSLPWPTFGTVYEPDVYPSDTWAASVGLVCAAIVLLGLAWLYSVVACFGCFSTQVHNWCTRIVELAGLCLVAALLVFGYSLQDLSASRCRTRTDTGDCDSWYATLPSQTIEGAGNQSCKVCPQAGAFQFSTACEFGWGGMLIAGVAFATFVTSCVGSRVKPRKTKRKRSIFGRRASARRPEEPGRQRQLSRDDIDSTPLPHSADASVIVQTPPDDRATDTTVSDGVVPPANGLADMASAAGVAAQPDRRDPPMTHPVVIDPSAPPPSYAETTGEPRIVIMSTGGTQNALGDEMVTEGVSGESYDITVNSHVTERVYDSTDISNMNVAPSVAVHDDKQELNAAQGGDVYEIPSPQRRDRFSDASYAVPETGRHTVESNIYAEVDGDDGTDGRISMGDEPPPLPPPRGSEGYIETFPSESVEPTTPPHEDTAGRPSLSPDADVGTPPAQESLYQVPEGSEVSEATPVLGGPADMQGDIEVRIVTLRDSEHLDEFSSTDTVDLRWDTGASSSDPVQESESRSETPIRHVREAGGRLGMRQSDVSILASQDSDTEEGSDLRETRYAEV